MISMFFVGSSNGIGAVVILTLFVLFSIFMTFITSKILSKTILKGVPSTFTLELPPYRTPQIGKVIWSSLCNRTLFVLGRAIVVAAPAGLLIWVFANVPIDGGNLLTYCASLLDPIAYWMGLDGVILMAFILGFPANEIVIPIIIMAYLSTGHMIEFENISTLRQLFIENGWTVTTAICTILFSMMHWPCSTTCFTIKKETGSWKWMFLAMFIPTIIGVIICGIVANILRFVL